jgi:hypothetical protein
MIIVYILYYDVFLCILYLPYSLLFACVLVTVLCVVWLHVLVCVCVCVCVCVLPSGVYIVYYFEYRVVSLVMHVVHMDSFFTNLIYMIPFQCV